MADENIWSDAWDADDDWSGGGAKSRLPGQTGEPLFVIHDVGEREG